MLFFLYCSGVDVLAVLQSIGISESIIGPLRDTNAGYFAVALAMYKLVTPLRYAVTIGNTCLHNIHQGEVLKKTLATDLLG